MKCKNTNCLNCGAPLKYGEELYESIAKCQYCGTEYHIDKLGLVEEFKVKLKINNNIVCFYVGSLSYEPTMIETTRLFDESLNCIQSTPNITLELHSYEIKQLKD